MLDVLKGLLVEAMSGPAGPSVTRRELFALPARLGCLGIIDPTKCLQRQFNASARLSEPLTTLIQQKNRCYPEAVRVEQKQAKAALHSQNHSVVQDDAEDLKKKLS